MFLAIADGKIAERNENIEPLLELDPAVFEIVEWNEPLPSYDPRSGEPQFDPRTVARKAADSCQQYMKDRMRKYPPIQQQLDTIYWDAIEGTTNWIDEITEIKNQYPKPISE